MFEGVKEALRRALNADASKAATKVAEAYIDQVEEEEAANRLTLKLNGVNARLDLIEKEKFKYQLLVKGIIDTWNSRKDSSKYNYKVIYEVSINPLSIGDGMVVEVKFNMKADDYDVYSNYKVMSEDRISVEPLYRDVYDDITCFGIMHYVNLCEEIKSKLIAEEQAKELASQKKQEEEKRKTQLEMIQIADGKRKGRNDAREAEYYAQRKLFHAVNKRLYGDVEQKPIITESKIILNCRTV